MISVWKLSLQRYVLQNMARQNNSSLLPFSEATIVPFLEQVDQSSTVLSPYPAALPTLRELPPPLPTKHQRRHTNHRSLHYDFVTRTAKPTLVGSMMNFNISPSQNSGRREQCVTLYAGIQQAGNTLPSSWPTKTIMSVSVCGASSHITPSLTWPMRSRYCVNKF